MPRHTALRELCGLNSAIGVIIIFLLIAASTIVALVFLAAFTWAVKSGQFEDDRSPGVRVLGDHLPRTPSVTVDPNKSK